MTAPVFIAEDLESTDTEYVLTGSEAKHAISVKRIQPGEHITLTNGVDVAYDAQVQSVQDKASMVVVLLHSLPCCTPSPELHVVQALPKSDRAELSVDLSVQAGATSITPWASSRSISQWGTATKQKKARTKWDNAAVTAMKQSRRVVRPHIHALASTADVLSQAQAKHTGQYLVLHESADVPLTEIDLNPHSITIVVGPEGGISPEELDSFIDAGMIPVKLGPEVLRCANAAGFALSTIGALSGRWN